MHQMNKLDDIEAQERMVRQQIIERGIRDERVLEAVRSIPRDKFFPQSGREAAYADRAAPIGHGQTISQPYMVALMTHRLDVQPTHQVLEIGTGSGYQTAILAKLAREVFSVERVKPLLDDAWERLMELGSRNVHSASATARSAGRKRRRSTASSSPPAPRNCRRNCCKRS